MISSRRITRVGNTPAMGTPDYMAPEQVKGKRADKRTDIYNLGALLYEMLTGAVPFPDENPWAALNARVTGDPAAPRKVNPDLSPQAEEIVLRALQRNPADRYPSAAAMKAELDTVEQVRVTGLCDRLQEPAAWKPGLLERPLVLAACVAQPHPDWNCCHVVPAAPRAPRAVRLSDPVRGGTARRIPSNTLLPSSRRSEQAETPRGPSRN